MMRSKSIFLVLLLPTLLSRVPFRLRVLYFCIKLLIFYLVFLDCVDKIVQKWTKDSVLDLEAAQDRRKEKTIDENKDGEQLEKVYNCVIFFLHLQMETWRGGDKTTKAPSGASSDTKSTPVNTTPPHTPPEPLFELDQVLYTIVLFVLTLLQHIEGTPRRSTRHKEVQSPATNPSPPKASPTKNKDAGEKSKGDKGHDGGKGEQKEDPDVDIDGGDGAPPLEDSEPEGEHNKGQKKKRKQVRFFCCLLFYLH
jgi:hypothetical protein